MLLCHWNKCNYYCTMSFNELMFKNRDGFHYKFPQNSCDRCFKYPCLPNMDKLKSNFAKFGCKYFEDTNIFKWKK